MTPKYWILTTNNVAGSAPLLVNDHHFETLRPPVSLLLDVLNTLDDMIKVILSLSLKSNRRCFQNCLSNIK